MSSNRSGLSSLQLYIAALLSAYLIVILIISCIIPPAQAADEPDHLGRAYLLSKGEIVILGSQHGVTGGRIDSGLLKFLDSTAPLGDEFDRKFTRQVRKVTTEITWTGIRDFRALPNTAAYFPVPYVPQAFGLFVGEHFGLNIVTSYYLTRMLSIGAAIGLLGAALSVYRVPFLVLSLFAMPETILQLGSASLDAIAFPTTALVGCLIARGLDHKCSFSCRMHITLDVCLLALATSRPNLIAISWLPAILYRLRQSRWYLFSAALVPLLSSCWIIVSMLTVRGISVRDTNAFEVLRYYINHPFSMLKVFYFTITNGEIFRAYWKSFIGSLGPWDGIQLDWWVYVWISTMLTTVAALTFDRSTLRPGASALTFSATLAALLIFVMELVGFTPHPAIALLAIGGRYFIPIAILLGFALFNGPLAGRRSAVSAICVFMLAMVSVVDMTEKLLDRYWLG